MQCDDTFEDQNEPCDHIAIVSKNATHTICMDCLREWPKSADFKSDFTEYDNRFRDEE